MCITQSHEQTSCELCEVFVREIKSKFQSTFYSTWPQSICFALSYNTLFENDSHGSQLDFVCVKALRTLAKGRKRNKKKLDEHSSWKFLFGLPNTSSYRWMRMANVLKRFPFFYSIHTMGWKWICTHATFSLVFHFMAYFSLRIMANWFVFFLFGMKMEPQFVRNERSKPSHICLRVRHTLSFRFKFFVHSAGFTFD